VYVRVCVLCTQDGFTPMAIAIQQRHERVIAALQQAANSSTMMTSPLSSVTSRLPPLHAAAKRNDVELAASLLQRTAVCIGLSSGYCWSHGWKETNSNSETEFCFESSFGAYRLWLSETVWTRFLHLHNIERVECDASEPETPWNVPRVVLFHVSVHVQRSIL